METIEYNPEGMKSIQGLISQQRKIYSFQPQLGENTKNILRESGYRPRLQVQTKHKMLDQTLMLQSLQVFSPTRHDCIFDPFNAECKICDQVNRQNTIIRRSQRPFSPVSTKAISQYFLSRHIP